VRAVCTLIPSEDSHRRLVLIYANAFRERKCWEEDRERESVCEWKWRRVREKEIQHKRERVGGGDRETERSREKTIKAGIIKKRKKTHTHRNYNKKQKIKMKKMKELGVRVSKEWGGRWGQVGVVVAMAVTHRSLVNNAKAKFFFFFWVSYINV